LPYVYIYFLFELDISQSPFDQDDKEVAESMSCTTNYSLQFEASKLFSYYDFIVGWLANDIYLL